jgi:hypothetical protein
VEEILLVGVAGMGVAQYKMLAKVCSNLKLWLKFGKM